MCLKESDWIVDYESGYECIYYTYQFWPLILFMHIDTLADRRRYGIHLFNKYLWF